MFGQVVLKQDIQKKSVEISYLPDGIYLVGLKSERGLAIIGKVIKV